MNTVIGLVLVLEIICLLQFCQIHSSVIKKSHLSGWIDVMVHTYISQDPYACSIHSADRGPAYR